MGGTENSSQRQRPPDANAETPVLTLVFSDGLFVKDIGATICSPEKIVLPIPLTN